MQPTYLPWCGFFDLLDQADVFVLLDTVAVSKQSWQTRNRIRARDGNVVWLSVPTNATPGLPLSRVMTADSRWQAKHWRTLESAYGHAPHWEWLRYYLHALYHGVRADTLVSWNTSVFGVLALLRLGIERRILLASEDLGLPPAPTDPIDRLRHICAQVGAHEYLSPQGARSYLEGREHELGIQVRWHDYTHPVYDQGGAPWVSHLSVVDLLAWHGPDSLGVIRSGRGQP